MKKGVGDMEGSKVIEAYELYGFELLERVEEKGYIIFGYETGCFYNIEIVRLNNEEETCNNVQLAEEKYRKSDFDKIKVSYFESLGEVHRFLFDAFFKPKINKDKLKNEYEDYQRRQSEKLQCKYKYIEGNYQCSDAAIRQGLVQYVAQSNDENKEHLIILEAAAGYGKTCAVYEILYKLLEKEQTKFPLFIELSKNRNARLFRYVLQDEINKKFRHVSYDLVIHEIKQGNLPLIIDGFDELLEQGEQTSDDSEERSLSMLTTIVELLGEDSKAWILLTTRNSALFSGDLFEQWVLNRIGKNCSVDRLRILKPSVKDWLGKELYEYYKNKKVDIENIANPVLLTFIKNATNMNQNNMICDMESALGQYFKLLLKRDRERQNLPLTEKEQYSILMKLAAAFAEYDFRSDNIDFIQQLLSEILEPNMLEFLNRYNDDSESDYMIQTGQELTQRLSHSCLLDRIALNQNEYGFINEFVLGILVGDAIIDNHVNVEDISELFINIVLSSFENRRKEKRLTLYKKLEVILNKVPGECKLNIQKVLLQEVRGGFNELYIQSMIFSENVQMKQSKTFTNCIFDGCTFDGCIIDPNIFYQCKFFNCKFYNLRLEGDAQSELLFMNCEGEGVFKCHKEVRQEEVDKYEKLVLEQFWKPGYQTAELRRTYTAFFKGIDPKEHGYIQEAVHRLLKEQIIRQLNICYEMNVGKMGEIKKILGRQ